MRQIVFVTALLGLAALDCSDSKPSAPPYPDPGSFCTGLAQAECGEKVLTACFQSTSSDKKTACMADREAACDSEIVRPAQAIGLTYDLVQAEACVGATGSAYSDASITSNENAKITTTCGRVFSRMGARNSVCTSDADCKRSDGLSCVIHPSDTIAADAGTAEGTCQKPSTPVPGGNSCAAPDAVCVTGYHCASSLHCEQDVAPGGKCNVTDRCASTAKCSPDGICVVKLDSGATCTNNEDCQSGICLQGANLCAEARAISATDPFCTNMRQ